MRPDLPSAATGRSSVPLPAIILTAAGALPFIGLALAPLVGLRPFGRPPVEVLGLYALTILSFIGAIHWGLAMARADGDETWTYVASIIPALLGWFALAFLPEATALRVMAAGFIALLLYDLRASRLGTTPAWYPQLRVPVTIVVVVALLMASGGR